MSELKTKICPHCGKDNIYISEEALCSFCGKRLNDESISEGENGVEYTMRIIQPDHTFSTVNDWMKRDGLCDVEARCPICGANVTLLRIKEEDFRSKKSFLFLCRKCGTRFETNQVRDAQIIYKGERFDK